MKSKLSVCSNTCTRDMTWIVLPLLLAVCLAVQDPPVAQFPQGTMVGTWFTTRGGRNVQGYRGIPFAAPPLGPLRFKPPQPPLRWEGVFDATQQRIECSQAINPIGTEDCLYLNVYTPKATQEPRMAVMVFLFGGAFEIGSTSNFVYGPQYFLDEDIVLVTLNYRLGILGFLSLEDPVLPGNLGLKDQRAALRWVQRNILYFGGDPRRVTIFGESAGAASVHYQMKFSSHQGLFRAAILQSGSSFDCWAFQPPGSQQIYVDYIATVTGCDKNDPPAFVECLRGFPAEYFSEILTLMLINYDALQRKITLLPPMVEPPGSEDPFITADPWTIPTSVPMMAGVTERECLSLNLPPYLEQDQTNSRFERFNMNYTSYMPTALQYNTTAEDPILVSKLLKEFYIGDEPFSRLNYLDIVDLFSDGTIINGVFRAARSNRQKTYFYYFTYVGLYTVTFAMGSAAKLGAAHADELFYFFLTSLPPDSIPQDVALSKTLIKMWTNFAKYLDPSPDDIPVQWDPVTTPNIEYLHIGQTNLTMEKDFLKTRMDFWDELPFRNKPFEFKFPSAITRSLSVGKIIEKYLGNRQGLQRSHLDIPGMTATNHTL